MKMPLKIGGVGMLTRPPFFLTAQRAKDNQVDFSGRTGMSLAGWFPKSPMDDAIEYFGYDWEMGEVRGERERKYRA
jgi:hypothetical protein